MTDGSALRLQNFLPYRLAVTSNLVSGAIAIAYDRLFGLRIPEWRVIAVIAESDGVTQQAIGTATRMDKVTVSRAAVALADRTLVERRPNPADGRSHLLYLTAAGRTLYDQIAPKALELEAMIFADFNAAELDDLKRLLHRVEKAALVTIETTS